MDDPFLMGGFQSFGNLAADSSAVSMGRVPLCSSRSGQRLPLDQFQNEEALAVGFFQTVDGGDVGMIERGQQLGFALEARQPFRIAA